MCYTNIVDKFSRSAKFTGIFQPTLPPFKFYCYYVTCTIICTIYMYICFPPFFEWQFLLYKICVWICGIFFWGHLMYQWQFSSTIWILWLRHLMNKWQFSFNVCLLCFCPQTELACVDNKYFKELFIRNLRVKPRTSLGKTWQLIVDIICFLAKLLLLFE